jgi:formate hydrogenlyase subunit 3/multisubunit Na+/H+ antiporter MnhD subunit
LKPLLTGRYAGFLCRLSDGLNGIRHFLGAGALARLFAGDFLVFVVAAELLAISVFPLVKERLKPFGQRAAKAPQSIFHCGICVANFVVRIFPHHYE